MRQVRQVNSPQANSDLPNRCQAPKSKIFRWSRRANHWQESRTPAHTRGASRSSRNVGQGCDGRFGVRRARACRTKTPKRTAKSCGPDTRCWCQACGNYPAGDGDKTNSLTGESTKYAVKPLRRGCRCVHRSPVCSCAPRCTFLAHETAGAARTRHSLRPLFSRRDNEFGKLGQIHAARSRSVISAV